jgi:DNA-binding NtrC family response regulator
MMKTTVLLADDEDTLRDNLAQVLSEEGFRVIPCRDGTQAIKALRQAHVDAIVTDLRMPGVTGMDLILQARKLAPQAAIIVLTAFGQVETAVEAMKNGVSEYICKPLILDEVVFKVKRALAREEIEQENELLRKRVDHASEEEFVPSCASLPELGCQPADLRTTLQACERFHITSVLARTAGNKLEAARILGIGMSSLYRKIDELGLAKEAAPETAAS